jgi:hypothetical protein
LIGIGYVAAIRLLDLAAAQSEGFVRYDVGQYRHALDVAFASPRWPWLCPPPSPRAIRNA